MSDATLSPELVSFDDLIGRVHAALKAWHKVAMPGRELLDDLLLYQNAHRESENGNNLIVPRSVTNKVLTAALDQLKVQNADYAKLLHHRFVAGSTMAITSDVMDWTLDQVRHHQRSAIVQLAEIIGLDEERIRKERVEAIESTFPPSTYTQLFGLKEVQRKLVTEILSYERSWVLAITGIGGIGKTALADSVTRIVLQHFRYHRFVWLRVDAKLLGAENRDLKLSLDLIASALGRHIAPDAFSENVTVDDRIRQVRQILKEQPHFVIIDNLESIANTALMLRQLQDWANPSKFLLTTRIRPTGEASVYTHQISELGLADSAELLRQHARSVGQFELANFSDEEAKRVYDVVGGNPLALRLVISLANTMPLPLILEDISRGHTDEIGKMYTRIYEKAWKAISPAQRMLLRAMPAVSNSGATVQHLQATSGLEDSELWPAINELVGRSLVELRGGAWDRRYGLHRITEAFLQTNINHWEEIEEEEELLL